MPEISVIMSVYNGAGCVEKAVASIQNQTFQDWEFIICDDASTDNTLKVLTAISAKDPRVIVLRNEENKRLAYSLNRALSVSKGKYIARMDDDDESLPERFATQLKYLQEHPDIDFAGCLTIGYDGKTDISVSKHKEFPSKEDFYWTTPFAHPTVMFRREALEKVKGYRVSKETVRSQDFDLFARMYAAGLKGANIQIPLFRYFINLDAMYKKHKYKFKVNEAIIRYKCYKALKLYPKGILFVIKPLVVGLIPKKLLYKYKERISKK